MIVMSKIYFFHFRGNSDCGPSVRPNTTANRDLVVTYLLYKTITGHIRASD